MCDLVDETLQEILAACETLGIEPSPIGMISESQAEAVLGVADRTLKTARCEGRPICRFWRINGGQVRYKVKDLAAALVDGCYQPQAGSGRTS